MPYKHLQKAIKTLRIEGRICIIDYQPTRSTPAPLYGLGFVDAVKPRRSTPAETSRAYRQRHRMLLRMRRKPKSDMWAGLLT